MKHEYIIKKNIFGGFDRADVINCLARLAAENNSKKQAEISAALNRIKELNEQITEKNKIINEYTSSLKADNINPEGREAARTADEVLNKAKIEVKRIKENIKIYTEFNSPKLEQLQKKISYTSDEISRLTDNIKKLSGKLDNLDFNDIKVSECSEKAEDIINNQITEIPIEQAPEPEKTDKIITPIPAEEVKEASLDLSEPATTSVEAEPSDSFNSIDNFFAEMDKLIAAKENPEPYLSVINENPIEHLK